MILMNFDEGHNSLRKNNLREEMSGRADRELIKKKLKHLLNNKTSRSQA